MRKIVVGLLVLMLLVPLVMVAAGCGGESTEDKEKTLCQDLADLETALTSMMNISLDSTLDDLEADLNAVEDAWDSVVSSAADVASAQIDDLKKAVENLLNTFDNIPSDASLAEALEIITANMAAVESAWKALTNSLNCDELLQE